MTPVRTGDGHLLVETQSGPVSARFLGDAVALARAGGRVTVFLVADGVAGAVRGARPELAELIGAGGQVWADDFTLAQRALTGASLEPGVVAVPMAEVAGLLLADGTRTVWH